MKNFLKKATSILLVFVLFCTAVLVSPVSTKAAQNYVTILHKVSTAQGNVPINYNFSLNRKSDIFFIIRTNERTGVTVSVKEPGHDIPCATITLAETNPDWEYNRDNGIYQNTAKINLASGKYILEVTFDIGVNFDLAMIRNVLVWWNFRRMVRQSRLRRNRRIQRVTMRLPACISIRQESAGWQIR